MATPDSFHITCLPLYLFTIPSLHNSLPCPLVFPLSLLLPQPAHCTLGFGTMQNLPQPRAQLGHRGWGCCTTVHSWGFCTVQKNVSRQSCLSLSFQEILSNPFFLFKTFLSIFSKGIDHFKKQQGLLASSHNPIPTLLRIIAGTLRLESWNEHLIRIAVLFPTKFERFLKGGKGQLSKKKKKNYS